MKKKIILIILIALTVGIAVCAASYGVYKYNDNNRVVVSVFQDFSPEKDGIFEIIATSYSEGLLSDKTQERVDKINSDLRHFANDEFPSKYTVPYNMQADYKNIDGKTVITYNGTAKNKESGEIEEVNKTFTYDFILVKNEDDIKR